MRKKIYTWHRNLSLIIAVPVLFWAISGFMHPLMTNIRPAVATQGLRPDRIDTQRIHVSLQQALRKNHVAEIAQFRLVHIDTNWFYQVQLVGAADAGAKGRATPVPVYLSCTNGNALPAGDWLYAQYLARQFLEGQGTATGRKDSAMGRNAGLEKSPGELSGQHGKAGMSGTAPVLNASLALTAVPAVPEAHDCCGAATDCVLNPVKGAKVNNVSQIHDFDREYKSINRLLPVYRVSFDRPDGIRVYVETTKDRFAFAMDNRRAFFDEVFRLLHTWGWLEFLGKGRLAVEVLLALLAFCTTVMGIWIFFVTKSKKVPGNGTRRYHRFVSITACLFTMFWTFSGAYHALSKIPGEEAGPVHIANKFTADSLDLDPGRILRTVGQPVTNTGLVRMNEETYWQVYAEKQEGSHGSAGTAASAKSLAGKGADNWHGANGAGTSAPVDLMRSGKAAMSPVYYLRTSDYSVLKDGDKVYARSLASGFSGHQPREVLSVTAVTSFGDEYNFTDKRLPVWRVGYAGNHQERYYVETSTGYLAKRTNDLEMMEGYSFALLHKHHFMDWGGKTVRDYSTLFWAFMQVVMVAIGLTLYFRVRRRKSALK